MLTPVSLSMMKGGCCTKNPDQIDHRYDGDHKKRRPIAGNGLVIEDLFLFRSHIQSS